MSQQSTDLPPAYKPARRIALRDFQSRPMRAFHVTWFSFFLCFFAWFAAAPLMVVIKEDLGLSQVQIGNTIIASVASTVFARLMVGSCCDHFGPRRTYRWLMILCSFPVMGMGLVNSYESFLLVRLAVGAVGASFVITQFHTSLMFAPNCLGTATATTAAWGNLGGGVTQLLMPLGLSLLIALGVDEAIGWRYAMVAPGLALLIMGMLYPRLTDDTPAGHFQARLGKGRSLSVAARDPRVWCLFGLYAACFGTELTVNNIAALYFHDNFGMGLVGAGAAASIFGLTNVFARSLGGYCSDRIARQRGLRGRSLFLFVVIVLEGLLLIAFSKATALPVALTLFFVFGVLVQMAEGATFGVVVFVKRKAMGAVVGMVAAGGNVGAVLAGFMFRVEGLPWSKALTILGVAITMTSLLALLIRFTDQEEAQIDLEFKGLESA